MILNKEQLEVIDRKLDCLGLDFLDFRLEIKDHIASQTEDLCNNKNLPFEEALKIIIEEWEPSLKLKESWLISNKRDFPTIVVNRLRKRFIVYNVLVLLGIIILTSIISIFPELLSKYENIIGHNFFRILYTGVLVIFLFLWYLIYRTKVNTSYSYQYRQNIIMLVFYQCLIFISSSGLMNLFNSMILIVVTPFLIYCFSKHNKFVHQYKLI